MAYRWNTPYEWLEHKASEWEQDRLKAELLALAIQTDSDTLQDLHQSEMDEDGYFNEVES